jgi:copper(I)-binding protein
MSASTFFKYIVVVVSLFVSANLKAENTTDLNDITGVIATQVEWRQPLPGQTVGVVYLTLNNSTPIDFQLDGISLSWARKAEFHQHFHEAGLMKMRKVSGLSLHAMEQLEFKPGGLHIMVFGVKPLIERQRDLTIRLNFNDSQSLTVVLPEQK